MFKPENPYQSYSQVNNFEIDTMKNITQYGGIELLLGSWTQQSFVSSFMENDW